MRLLFKFESILFGTLFSSIGVQTVLVHLSIFFRWPLKVAFVGWLLLIPICLFFASKIDVFGSIKRQDFGPKSSLRIYYYVLIFVLSLYALKVSVPDSDDMTLLHPALNTHLDQVYQLRDTLHNFGPLPQISFLHAITTYELYLKMVSLASSLDFLNLYYNTMIVIWVIFFLGTFRSLLSQLGLKDFEILGGLIGIAFLIMFEVRNPLGFGSVGLTRFFQGKSVLWVIFLPYLFLALRYVFVNPGLKNGIWLFMLSVVSMSLNNSAMFLVPVMVAAIGLSHLMMTLKRVTHLENFKSILFSFLAAVYPAIIGSLFVFHLADRPRDMSTWTVGWETNWVKLIGLVIGDGCHGLITISILFFGLYSLFAKSREAGFFFLSYLFFLCIACLNPISSQYWISAVTVGAFWRFAFLILFPVFFGIISAQILARDSKLWRRTVFALLIGVYLVGKTDSYYASRYSTKDFLAYRLPKAEYEFATYVKQDLEGSSVLTTEEMAHSLSIIQPTARFDMTLYGVTVHLFANVGREEEGRQRALAQRFIAFADGSPEVLKAFQDSVPRVNAIIMKKNIFSQLGLLGEELLNKTWRVAKEDFEYLLLKKHSI